MDRESVGQVDSQNLQAVKEIWTALEREGMCGGMEAMLARSYEDVEMRPYFAEGRTLTGATEIREFYLERQAAGASVHASPWSFEETGDDVTVTGSVRVQRADGSIADAQVCWTYVFRDGLICQAAFAPLASAISR
jgi:ketosteroid isomerase-like protein